MKPRGKKSQVRAVQDRLARMTLGVPMQPKATTFTRRFRPLSATDDMNRVGLAANPGADPKRPDGQVVNRITYAPTQWTGAPAGFYGLARIPGQERAYEDETSFRAYNLRAALNPDSMHIIPSHFGRLPYPVVPLRLKAASTIPVPASSILTVAFNPNYRSTSNTDQPLFGGYRVDTYATGGQDALATTGVLTAISRFTELVPTQPVSGSDYACLIACGSVTVKVVKASALDEDPTMTWSGPTNTRAIPQWFSGAGYETANEGHGQDAMKMQSPLGAPNTNVAAETYSTLDREKGAFFYGLLPMQLDERAQMKFRVLSDPGAANPPTSTFTRGGTDEVLNHPILTIKNSSSTNQITVILSAARNYFVVPTEQSYAANPEEAVREARFQMPLEAYTLCAGGAVAVDRVQAHAKAHAHAIRHPHAREHTFAPLTESLSTIHMEPKGSDTTPKAAEDVIDTVLSNMTKVTGALKKAGSIAAAISEYAPLVAEAVLPLIL